MKAICHWLAHRLNWNYGRPESYWQGSRLMMSFVCTGCGRRTGVHQVGRWGSR